MRKSGVFYHIFVTTLVCGVIRVTAITNSRDNDVLNLNGIQDGGGRDKGNQSAKYKDGTGVESQEKRSFFTPDVNRRGSFYPSGHGSTGFGVGSGINVGGSGIGPNYHTSGSGYSYGAPSLYPPMLYGGSYPSHSSPGSSSGGFGSSFGHSGGGGGGGHSSGGGFGLIPGFSGGHSGGGGGGGHSGDGGFGHVPGFSGGHSGGGYNKALALKGLLIPIAGVALLGAAAVLAKTNPVLLQLGVVSGKKKRSIMSENFYPANPHVRPEYRKI